MGSVGALAGGGFVVTWTDNSGSDGSGEGVFALVYAEDGSTAGVNFQVNSWFVNSQGGSKAVGLSDVGEVTLGIEDVECAGVGR